MVGKIGAYVDETFANMLYIITGNCSWGRDARSVFANQILKKSHIALTADALELYPDTAVPGLGPPEEGCATGVVCIRAWTLQ